MNAAETILGSVIARGDLAHLALFLWAAAASGLGVLLLRQIGIANARFDTLVRELARFNARMEADDA
jgi:hypothetical protein